MRILNLCGTNVWKKLNQTLTVHVVKLVLSSCQIIATKQSINQITSFFDYARIRQLTACIHPLLHHVCWAVCLGVSEPPSTEAWTVWKRATSRGAALPSLGQLSIHDYCLHAYYCSQNKRSTCLIIQKYTLSRWSAMCLAQGHTASMTSQQGKCDVVSDALAMIVSLKGHFSRRWHSAWIIAM